MREKKNNTIGIFMFNFLECENVMIEIAINSYRFSFL